MLAQRPSPLVDPGLTMMGAWIRVVFRTLVCAIVLPLLLASCATQSFYLIDMSAATVSGSTITLQKSSSREVQTHVRAKPGDTIFLAGIQYDKLSSAPDDGTYVVQSTPSDVMRSELIIIMRPQINHIAGSDDAGKMPATPVAAATPVPAPTLTEAPVPLPPAKYFAPKEIEELAVALPIEENAQAPDNAAPTGIYLQLGAFGYADNAERFRTDVDQRIGWRRDPGQSLRMITSALPTGGEIHRVVVGPFSDRQAAEKWASRSKRIGGSRPMLLTY